MELMSEMNTSPIIRTDHIQKASVTVEAAIVFPLFVLAWIPLLYMIRYCIVYEIGMQMSYSIAELVGEAGYLYELASLKEIQDDVWEGNEYHDSETPVMSFTDEFGLSAEENVVLFSGVLDYCLRVFQQGTDLSSGVKGEGWKMAVNLTGSLLVSGLLRSMTDMNQWKIWGIQDIRTHYTEMFYAADGYEDLIRIVLDIPLSWPDPFRIFGEKHLIVSAVTRAFIGVGKTEETEMEPSKEIEEEKVTYYRIGNGKKAHLHSCYLIEKDLHQIDRTTAIEKGYTACLNCNAQGVLVWVTGGGEKYHNYGCIHLFPNLTPISEDELASGRYTPCAICIGGGEWFTHG